MKIFLPLLLNRNNILNEIEKKVSCCGDDKYNSK